MCWIYKCVRKIIDKVYQKIGKQAKRLILILLLGNKNKEKNGNADKKGKQKPNFIMIIRKNERKNTVWHFHND